MADELPHGFKAEAEKLALVVRDELRLGLLDALDCVALAEEWGIPVVAVDDLRQDGVADAHIQLLMIGGSGFSAATVVSGTKRLIVYNPRHTPGRRANSLAHELAHVVLEHEAAPALGIKRCRH